MFHGLDFIFSYSDDILMASKSEEICKKHLEIVFERLNFYGLIINLPKRETGQRTPAFRSYFICQRFSTNCWKGQWDLTVPITGNSQPTPSVLRHNTFCRRFLPNSAAVIFPLAKLLKSTKANFSSLPSCGSLQRG